ncbi:dihydroorotate dehydrogenase [Candidatus Fermentibacteria bacterium]|nr:dihydroorotate dehydrogenase [Candidatus Fermentibacteria bacterium]
MRGLRDSVRGRLQEVLHRRPGVSRVGHRLGGLDGAMRLREPTAADLRPELLGTAFRSPILLASGTAGFGLELLRMDHLDGVGGLVSKATTLKPREGNPPPRIAETRFGLLNAIGLANPGVDSVLSDILPRLSGLPCPLLVNVAGSTEQEYGLVVERLEESDLPLGYEINVSCPNVAEGGMLFGADPAAVERISRRVADRTRKPFSVKLTPNEGSIVESAAAAEEGGADAVTVCNTFLGMSIDWREAKPQLSNLTGGYTSPTLLPLVVARVYSVSGSVQIPVIASGGVGRAEDVLELLSAGARLVEVGTLLLRSPDDVCRLTKEMEGLLE